MAGPDEYVYIIVEGLAEVILEKTDFCYYSLDSTKMFLTDQEDQYAVVESTLLNWLNASKKIDQGREEAIDVKKILHESMQRMMHGEEV